MFINNCQVALFDETTPVFLWLVCALMLLDLNSLWSFWIWNFQVNYSLRRTYTILVKGIVDCQKTRDMIGGPRMQQWPLDIPQWHITPHPQLSANIIIPYAFQTHRIKSKFPNNNKVYILEQHLWVNNSPILSCGLCVKTKMVVSPWGSRNSWSSCVLTVWAFPVNTAQSLNVGLMVANVADVCLTLKQHWINISFK